MDIAKLIPMASNMHGCSPRFTQVLSEIVCGHINKKQIVDRIGSIPISFYSVKYEYTTIRGNRKEGEKIFTFQTFSPEEKVNSHLNWWVEDYNRRNPKRTLSNVKFLGSEYLGYIEL